MENKINVDINFLEHLLGSMVPCIIDLRENNPEDFNILDCALKEDGSQILENTHSKILANILSYNPYGNYPILNSFLKNVLKLDIVFDYNKLHISCLNMDIDVLATDYKSAIIIENKINDADDQPNQIEKYIGIIHEYYNISFDCIYVVYLTRNGTKIVSNNSLTEMAKANLGCSSNNNGNFITVNYKNDIIKWLMLLKCGCSMLQSNIDIYLNYLNNLFIPTMFNRIEKKMADILLKNLYFRSDVHSSDVSISDLEFSQRISLVDSLQNSLYDLKINYLKQFWEKLNEKFDKELSFYWCNDKGKDKQDIEGLEGFDPKKYHYCNIGYTRISYKICVEFYDFQICQIGIRSSVGQASPIFKLIEAGEKLGYKKQSPWWFLKKTIDNFDIQSIVFEFKRLEKILDDYLNNQ